jgi:hypothetical protein
LLRTGLELDFVDLRAIHRDGFEARHFAIHPNRGEILDAGQLHRDALGRLGHVVERSAAAAAGHVVYTILQEVLVVVVVAEKSGPVFAKGGSR